MILNAINDVTSLIKDLPIYIKITSLFTLLPIYIFKDSIGVLIKKIPITKLNLFKKKEPIIEIKQVIKYKEKTYDFKQLMYHDFFISLKQVPIKVRQIDFSNDKPINTVKRKMMLLLIEHKMIYIDINFKNLIKQNNISNLSSQEFKYEVVTTIQKLIKEYNNKAVEDFLQMGISKDDSWIFVDSYESYRTTVIESFIERLESICISTRYTNNYERLQAMFEVLTVAVDIIPRDVKSLYLIINGNLDKYIKR